MAKARDDDGLTLQESRAAVLKAQGLSQSAAWRQAFNRPRVKPETAWTEASKVFTRPNVAQRVRDLLRAARIGDIESVGEAFATMQEDMEAARKDGNHNAVAQYTRIKMQAHGALKDNVSLTVEQRASDAELIKTASDGDPDVAAALRKLLGSPDTFDAPKETRH
jgi:hypothetical protein